SPGNDPAPPPYEEATKKNQKDKDKEKEKEKEREREREREKEREKEKKEKEKEKEKRKKEKSPKELEAGDAGEIMNGFFDQIGAIRDMIASVKQSIDQIEQLHQQALTIISEEQSQENAREMERVMDRTNKQSADIRNRLKAMDAENKRLQKEHPGSSDVRIRISQHGTVAKKFLDVMMEYKEIQKKYQEKYKARMQRQYLIVNPNANDEDIQKMMDTSEGPVFAQEIMHSARRAEARRALEDIQNRHADIVRIEKSII
ncbi:Plasma membrane t-SNARE, secretory vesicle fusion, partial [Quaeritorhiza haematococci]